ncbi:type II toxin-antitoxin system toxin DNA ADP-ribosyl transferase DarT [Rouxiella silvae]|nr:DUF4433 domain-containing protein [Rouxiella silvae]
MPSRPKIYHILHVDRLSSVVQQGLLCDAEISTRANQGPMIGMSNIKQRRLEELSLSSHPNLFVGQCVPFYFCPRSVMLYLIYRRNSELSYTGGQQPIIHLQLDLYDTIRWAQQQGRRWSFTLSNAGSNYFEDRCNLNQLNEINWSAVQSIQWGGDGGIKEAKQAEFLLERDVPWLLIEKVGVFSNTEHQQVADILRGLAHRPDIEIQRSWYY